MRKGWPPMEFELIGPKNTKLIRNKVIENVVDCIERYSNTNREKTCQKDTSSRCCVVFFVFGSVEFSAKCNVLRAENELLLA
jgi:hypothetical protein